MNRSDTLTKLAPALVKALAEIGGVGKNARNTAFGGFKYATLENVIDTAKPHLIEQGLAVFQLPGALCDGVLTIETVIMHESGEWVSGDFGILLGKADPQGVGSAVSYARRYALMAALNMPAVDDDGEAAMGNGSGNSRPAPSQAPQTGIKRLSSARAKEIGLDDKLKDQINACHTRTELAVWDRDFDKHTGEAPLSWLDSIRNHVILRGEEIDAEAAGAHMDDAFKNTVGPSVSQGAARAQQAAGVPA